MKRNNKLTKPIHEIADENASRLVATYGIKDAERIAKLIYEKVTANKKSLERKYKE